MTAISKQLPPVGMPLTDSKGTINSIWYNYLNAISMFTGTVINLPGSTGITVLGTVTTGTWNGSKITSQYGGTGVNNGTNTLTYGQNVTFSGGFPTTIASTATSIATLPTGTTTLVPTTGTGASGSWNINAATVTTNANLTGVVTSSGNATSFATMSTNSVLLGNGTSTPQQIAPGATGNELVSNGTTWSSQSSSFCRSFLSMGG